MATLDLSDPSRTARVTMYPPLLPLLLGGMIVAGQIALPDSFWNGLTRFAYGASPNILRDIAWGIAAALLLWGSMRTSTHVDTTKRRIVRTRSALWFLPIRSRAYPFDEVRYVDFRHTAQSSAFKSDDSAPWHEFALLDVHVLFLFLAMLLFLLLGSWGDLSIGHYEVKLVLTGNDSVLCYRSIGETKAQRIAIQLSRATNRRLR